MLDLIWLIDWRWILERFSPVGTRLLQLNFWSVWLCLLIVAVIALLQILRRFKPAHDVRRFSLLLVATFIPVVMFLWSVVPASVQSNYPELFPWLWKEIANGGQEGSLPFETGLIVGDGSKHIILTSYLAWLVFYPLLWFQAISRRTASMRDIRFVGEVPAWSLPRNREVHEKEWVQRRRRIYNYLKIQMSIRRPINVIEAADSSPFTFGWFRPVLVLPHRLCERHCGIIGDEEFRCILAHEFAHVKYHNLLHFYHHLATWFFFPALFPIILFNLLRSRIDPSTRTAGYELCFISPAAKLQVLPLAGTRLAFLIGWLRKLFQLFTVFPECIELMAQDFELHADAAAVLEARVDEKVLKRTLALAILHRAAVEQVDPNLEQLRNRIEEILVGGYDSVRTFLDRLLRRRPKFVRREVRFLDLSPGTESRVGGSLFVALSMMVFLSGVPVALLSPLFGILEPFQDFAQNPSYKSEKSKGDDPPPTSVARNDEPVSPREAPQPLPIPPFSTPPQPQVKSFIPLPQPQVKSVADDSDRMAQFNAANEVQRLVRESIDQLNQSEARRRNQEMSSRFSQQQDVSRQIAVANDLQRKSQEDILRQSQQVNRSRQQTDQANAERGRTASLGQFGAQQQATERSRQREEGLQKAGAAAQRAVQQQNVVLQNFRVVEKINNQALAHQQLENQSLKQVRQLQNVQAVNNALLTTAKLNDQLVTIQRQPQASAKINNDALRIAQPRIPNPPSPTYTPSVSSLPRTYQTPRTFTQPYTPPRTFETPSVSNYTPPRTFDQPRTYTPTYSPPVRTYTPPPSTFNPPRTYTPPPTPRFR
jgi:Zn-dependent protease with chaperone function